NRWRTESPRAYLGVFSQPWLGNAAQAVPGRQYVAMRLDACPLVRHMLWKTPKRAAEAPMAVSRRGFLKLSGAAAAGTALGGVAGLGLDVKPARAAAQAMRIQNAKAVPSVCPYCA